MIGLPEIVILAGRPAACRQPLVAAEEDQQDQDENYDLGESDQGMSLALRSPRTGHWTSISRYSSQTWVGNGSGRFRGPTGRTHRRVGKRSPPAST